MLAAFDWTYFGWISFAGPRKKKSLMSWCKRYLISTISSSNSPWSFEGFRRTLKQHFNWIRQQMKNFPIDPHCKFLTRCQIWIKISPKSSSKTLNDQDEFELHWARCYKNIAENSFAMGHETDRMGFCRGSAAPDKITFIQSWPLHSHK